MIASLYQSGSGSGRAPSLGRGGRGAPRRRLHRGHASLRDRRREEARPRVAPGRARRGCTGPVHAWTVPLEQVDDLAPARRPAGRTPRAAAPATPPARRPDRATRRPAPRRRPGMRGCRRSAGRCRSRGTAGRRSLERRVLAPNPVDAGDEVAQAVAGRSRSQVRCSYFSESRYSSLPGSRGVFAPSSKAGP